MAAARGAGREPSPVSGLAHGAVSDDAPVLAVRGHGLPMVHRPRTVDARLEARAQRVARSVGAATDLAGAPILTPEALELRAKRPRSASRDGFALPWRKRT